MATFNSKKRWQVQKLLLCILLVGSSTDFKMLTMTLHCSPGRLRQSATNARNLYQFHTNVDRTRLKIHDS